MRKWNNVKILKISSIYLDNIKIKWKWNIFFLMCASKNFFNFLYFYKKMIFYKIFAQITLAKNKILSD